MRRLTLLAAVAAVAGAHDAAAALAGAPVATGEVSYAASVAAFSALGHGIIDDVEMLGRRQDAHPGSHNGEGDTVHYCLPGPIDYALDEVIRVLRRSFDRAPRFYGV